MTAADHFKEAKAHRFFARNLLKNGKEQESWFYLLLWAHELYKGKAANLLETSNKKRQQQELWIKLGFYARNRALLDNIKMRTEFHPGEAAVFHEASQILFDYEQMVRKEMKCLTTTSD